MLHGKLDVGTFPGAEPCVAGARALAVRWHGLPQQLLRLRAAALRPGYLRLGQLLHAHQAPVQRKNNGMLGDMCTPSLGKLYVGNMVMSGSMFAGVNEKLAFIWEPVINQITGATDWGHVSPTTPRCGRYFIIKKEKEAANVVCQLWEIRCSGLYTETTRLGLTKGLQRSLYDSVNIRYTIWLQRQRQMC
ncbi:uncharacterized protein LOC125178206 isoform X1 [Hyalella azteca]|uniref:Uncharacterized protein LOC125178206 isoform X1 n=1 Tax=Hyalella azteca TaxID=294128 RepID=A0A979FKV6_HYAAZ|nr:uncharacterized protein LOC125178206 isoform X1 [Hyalella azteca]